MERSGHSVVAELKCGDVGMVQWVPFTFRRAGCAKLEHYHSDFFLRAPLFESVMAIDEYMNTSVT